jgi:leucyl-tRNA synthetase
MVGVERRAERRTVSPGFEVSSDKTRKPGGIMQRDGRDHQRYSPAQIEPKWRRRWDQSGLYRTDLSLAHGRPKHYNLMEFPYPSAEGLHVGHVYTYGGADTSARFLRMRGCEVFEPMGFDAFGIHSENYALRLNINPMELTARTTRRYRDEQLSRIGGMFDWSHSVDTSDPRYYRWTQWLFLQLFKAGLAYRKEAPVNWCPNDLTVLANEQVIDGRCERCGAVVVQKELTQWFLRITAYADRLLHDLDGLDWPEESKVRQANWIGKSEGAELIFTVQGSDDPIPVFTTRPDTVFGATYLVLAPEHPLVPRVTTTDRQAEVEAYVEQARNRTEIDRTNAEREKTGVFTGAYAVNPATGQPVPIWAADYVLAGYGTGAIMAVPAHDERDFAFAKTFGLPIVEVVQSAAGVADEAYTGPGTLTASEQFDGMTSDEAKVAITAWLAELHKGEPKVTYRLRDWLISRQRYWGPPIPIVYCQTDGIVPVPEEDLPVLLPEIEEFRPTGTGQSPLASIESFVNTTCPVCGGPARRETDVSDTFLDSSWYYYRYPCTEWDDRLFDRARLDRWLPVDMYFGGKEHVVLHHLYARFVTKALYDLGLVPTDEPFKRLRLHGFLTRDGAKISKSRGNVVNPDEYIDRVGADAFRMYLLFMGPYDQDNDFSDTNLVGVTRFLERVWRLFAEPRAVATSKATASPGEGVDLRPLHRFVKRLTDELSAYQFHTAIAGLMELTNWAIGNSERLSPEQQAQVLRTLVLLLAPFAPFLAEELWERLGETYSVHQQAWPSYDPAQVETERVTLVVQVNGKVRDRLEAAPDIAEKDARAQALKVIYVPGRLVNVVV